MEALKTFLINYFSTVLMQLLLLFGPLTLFGLLVHYIQRLGIKLLSDMISERPAIIVSGFLGIPIHEIGHAFFCIIFGHKIESITFFDPDGESLGSVEHSYEADNWWKIMGNYFIGTGPIIFGSIIIALMITFLLPNGTDYFSTLWNSIQENGNNFLGLLQTFGDAILLTLKTVFIGNLATWQFWVFIIISFNISLHMSLSLVDIRGALTGFFKILTVILIFNAVYVWLFFFIKFDRIIPYLFFYNSIALLSVLFSLMVLIIISFFFLLFFIYQKIKYGRFDPAV